MAEKEAVRQSWWYLFLFWEKRGFSLLFSCMTFPFFGCIQKTYTANHKTALQKAHRAFFYVWIFVLDVDFFFCDMRE